MFVDSARIFVKSGRGGAGAISFRREKYVPKGGPDGGDGGRGGSVYVVARHTLRTLLSFKYKRRFEAQNGVPGMGALKSGLSGKDCYIYVPIGTQIFIDGQSEPIADLIEPKQKMLVAKGGRGGRGNTHFKSATNQAPRRADPGEQCEERWLSLELKLLADVGLVGMPNAGKSTLLAALTRAKPKIASYPFTTLSPNLGVVEGEHHRSFVIADIPGLIEGAHSGSGLGDEFLKHVERTRVLLHLVDLSDESAAPLERFKLIENELFLFNESLVKKPKIVLGTKTDVSYDDEKEEELKAFCSDEEIPYYRISAAAHKGLNPLMKRVWSYFEDD
jgi:GTPase